MKIAIVSSTVFTCPPAGYSGLEQLAWQRAEGLAQLGHETYLIAPQGSKCDHATVIPTGPPGGWDEKRAYGTYWQELLKMDAIIDESWNKWSYILKSEGRLKAPVLGVCHAPVNTMYQTLPPVENPCFVCISKDQANHFEALFSRPARVAYNGIDLGFYRAIPGIHRTDRFLFLARFSTIKGPDLAIEAAKFGGAGLDLVGDTTITNEPEYFEACKRNCDGKSIRMVGPASRGECVKWFTQSFCLLHPNQRFREPFGLAPVEAMACGCPVIAWNFGAMKETVKHGETGFLVNNLQEMVAYIKKLKDSPKLISRDLCVERASHFSVDRMVRRYDELVNEAVGTGGW